LTIEIYVVVFLGLRLRQQRLAFGTVGEGTVRLELLEHVGVWQNFEWAPGFCHDRRGGGNGQSFQTAGTGKSVPGNGKRCCP